MYLPWDDLEAEFVSIASIRLKDLWKSWTGQYRSQLRSFHPKIRLFIEKDAYAIKTVESSWELEAALKLRHEVFYQEILQKPVQDGFDIDEFDLQCDHLVIVETRTNRVIGTYRLNSTAYSESFYSNKEFVLDELLRLPGPKLELGRACIHKDFRNGFTLALLWKGIVQYAERVGAERLFGCSSIQTTDPYQALKISAYVKKNGYALTELHLTPRPSYRFTNWDDFRARYENFDHESLVKARKEIPPLLLAYLRIGARVGSEPALDRSFRCVDFITILETQMIASAYERKFSRC